MKFSKAIEGYKLSCLTEGYSPNAIEGYECDLPLLLILDDR